MNFKKIAALLTALCMCGAMFSCSEVDSETIGEETTEELESAEETTAAPEVSDGAVTVPEGSYVIDGVVVYDPTVDYTALTKSDGLDENGFFEGVTAKDIVSLPQFTGLKIDPELVNVTEEEIKEEIDAIVADNADYLIESAIRAIKLEDIIRIDYNVTVDGEQYGDGEVSDKVIKLGTDNIFGSMLEELIGLFPGDKAEIAVKVPDNWVDVNIAGKIATISVALDSVLEIDYDQMVKDFGFESMEEMEEDIKDYISSSNIFNFFSEVIKKASCENIPASVLKYIIELDISQYAVYAKSYGMELDEFLSTYYSFDNVGEFIEQNMDYFKENAVLYLSAQAIAETLGIKVADEDITEGGYGEYIEQFGLPYLKQFMMFQEILPRVVAGVN